jgi:hypothetical protein
MQSTQNGTVKSADVASAEAEALARQAAEEQAEERFDAARAELATTGRAHEVTGSAEFREWMAARVLTDDAWGRWAVAMDASGA